MCADLTVLSRDESLLRPKMIEKPRAHISLFAMFVFYNVRLSSLIYLEFNVPSIPQMYTGLN